ncbi:hypothetical protein PRIC1_010155 [Phytophthora ramorum]
MAPATEGKIAQGFEGEMELFCGVYGEATIASVKMHRGAKVGALQKAIFKEERYELRYKFPARSLTLRLARKGKEWLRVDENTEALLRGSVDADYNKMLVPMKLSSYFGPDAGLKEGVVHVLVELPPDQHQVCEFSAHAAEPLVSSVGSEWDFQDPSSLEDVADAIPAHFAAWKKSRHDKRSHPLFLCLDGPGTGKSRLLNEFPRLLKKVVAGNGNREMVGLLQNAFTFNVTLENGTGSGYFTNPSLAIGTRMLYQLQNSLKWATFYQEPAHHLDASAVLAKLCQVKGISSRDLCVILCVDSLQKLGHQAGSKASPFYQAIATLCDLVNASDCWVIAIASATIYQPVNEFLSDSSQWHSYLHTTRLSRSTIKGEDVFQGLGDEDLVQLLVDDMGGFGRYLEELYKVLVGIGRKGEFNFALVLEKVVSALQNVYPDRKPGIENMREAFLAVVAVLSILAQRLEGSVLIK